MRLTINTKASSRRSKRLAWGGRLSELISRLGAVVENAFYNKLEKLNVQAGEKGKILLAHVQRICEAHDTVMQSYYQQIQRRWRTLENKCMCK